MIKKLIAKLKRELKVWHEVIEINIGLIVILTYALTIIGFLIVFTY